MPSLRVTPRGAYGNALRGRAGCVPVVWLDGALLRNGADELDYLIRPQNVTAIEVYGGGAVIPAQYNMTGTGGSFSGPQSCGAVVVWTAR